MKFVLTLFRHLLPVILFFQVERLNTPVGKFSTQHNRYLNKAMREAKSKPVVKLLQWKSSSFSMNSATNMGNRFKHTDILLSPNPNILELNGLIAMAETEPKIKDLLCSAGLV